MGFEPGGKVSAAAVVKRFSGEERELENNIAHRQDIRKTINTQNHVRKGRKQNRTGLRVASKRRGLVECFS